MKTLTLAAALAAATALSTPAFAAGSGDTAQSGMTNSTSTQAAAQMETGGKTAGMSGERMEEGEIREIQQALKDAGQDVEVDGQWGENTAEALRAYQEDEGLSPSGELDSQTLTALGLDLGTGINEGEPQTAESPDATPKPQDKPDAAGNQNATPMGGEGNNADTPNTSGSGSATGGGMAD